MKTILKSLVVISVLMCSSNNCFSNPDAQKDKSVAINAAETKDSLKTQLDKLQSSLEQNSYTRIPNKDFETIIDNKIQKSIHEIVNWWLIIIGSLGSVIVFLVNKYAKAYLQTILDGKVNQLKKDNVEEIKTISNRYFSTVIDSLIDFKIETITKKNNKVVEPVVDDLKRYLTDESITITKNKKVSLIDTIMRCYYYNAYPERIKKMIDLIKEYEEKFTLDSATYFNAAIAFADMYDKYGTKDYLNSAIENCNKSIKMLPDYGFAFAQKLELYIMAMSKAFDDAEKKQFESELLKVFKDIENNQSPILCVELINRFKDDEKSFMKPHLEKLYNDYSGEMAKITARATTPP